MICPPEIAEVVSQILAHGLVRIRAFAGSGQSRKCFIEADNLHNLPAILSDFRPERLAYYWDVERPSFMQQVPETERRDFQPLWNHLLQVIEELSLLRNRPVASVPR